MSMEKNKDCIFCKIVRGEVDSDKVGESDNFFAFLDAHPRAEGHVLIVPKKHYVTLLDIPEKLGNEMLEFTKKMASEILDKKLGDGFNIVMNNLDVADQVVMHAHLHIIPRKEGDGLRMIS